uniref:Proline, glutamate and leucine rich protein 1 n=1 Tax=Chelonoidis abingdonii TaxID=106734 RepID=A0A8C0J6P6_CHEAB
HPPLSRASQHLPGILSHSHASSPLHPPTPPTTGDPPVQVIHTSPVPPSPVCQLSALEGIKACMTCYPRACGSLRGKLAAYFLSRVDAESPQLQQLACECYALLPSLGAGFTHGLKHTECWEQELHALLATLHGLLGNLYEGAETGKEDTGVTSGETDAHTHAQERAHLVTPPVCGSLSEFVAPVTVPVQDVLDLVCRALNISIKNISWFGDGPLKMLLLPSVHLEILDVLAALILACGARLARWGSVLGRLFPQVLGAWSSSRDSVPLGQEKPYSAVRTRLYQVLELWVQVGGAGAGVLQGPPHRSEALLAHLLSDIAPPTDSVKVSPPGRPGSEGKPSAPKKPKLSEGGDAPSLHRKQDAMANSDVCKAALQGLSRAILLGGTLVKEETHRRLQELVVPLLLRLAQGDVPPGSPYTSPACRHQLYRLLLALLLAPAPACPPPLHCALRAFVQGQRDPSLQVSSFCAEALVTCSALARPRVPSLQLPFPGPAPLAGPAPADLAASPLRQTPPFPRLARPPLVATQPRLAPPPAAPFCCPRLAWRRSREAGDPGCWPRPRPRRRGGGGSGAGGQAPRPRLRALREGVGVDVEISAESDSDESGHCPQGRATPAAAPPPPGPLPAPTQPPESSPPPTHACHWRRRMPRPGEEKTGGTVININTAGEEESSRRRERIGERRRGEEYLRQEDEDFDEEEEEENSEEEEELGEEEEEEE